MNAFKWGMVVMGIGCVLTCVATHRLEKEQAYEERMEQLKKGAKK